MVSEKEQNTRAINIFLFVLFTSIYLLSASKLMSSDTGGLRNEVVESIVERQNLSVPAGMGMMGADGREYSWFGIGSVLLAIPFYVAGKLSGVHPREAVSIMNQLFGAATVVLVFLFSHSFGYAKRASVLTAVSYGLGTMAWFYAKDPGDHAIETFFVLLSVYSMYRHAVNPKVSWLMLSAVSFGFAFLTRSSSVLVIPSLIILMVLQCQKETALKTKVKLILRNSILLAVVLLPFAAINCWYNYYRFGSLFESGYALMASRLGIDYFGKSSIAVSLIGLLASPGKGFFYYSPVAVLFFFSLRGFFKKHPGPAISFVVLMVSYLFFYANYLYWHGDWAWGPRYIFVLTPFIILPTANLFDSSEWSKGTYIRMAVYSLLSLSLAVQLASVTVHPFKYFDYLHKEKKVKFSVAYGKGAQQINVPPNETYFDWRLSPILAQFRFIQEITIGMNNYRHQEPLSQTDGAKVLVGMKVFDLWWVYWYLIERSYRVFIAVGTLILLAAYSATRLWKIVA